MDTTTLLQHINMQHGTAFVSPVSSPAVHGDFTPDNLLVEHGRISGVIDCTYAGYGSRAIDLATLLHYAYCSNYGDVVRVRLWERVEELVGRGGLAICLTYRIMAMTDWAIQRDTPAAVRLWMSGGWRIYHDLQRQPT